MSSKGTKTSAKSRAQKVKNRVERKFEDIKELAGDLVTKVKDEGKNILSNKIGLGEQLWLSDLKKSQKALFKKLHQETAKSLGVAKWSENTEISVDSYTSRIAQELEAQTLAYITKISTPVSGGLVSNLRSMLSRDQGLVLLRGTDGKRIHFLSQPFFSQSISGEEKTISWAAFKETEFYPYIRNLELTSRAVADELSLAKKLKQAHTDLSQEQGVDEIKLVDLRKRLESYNFQVSPAFWSQTFWNKDYELDAVSLEKFMNLAGGKRSIEELEQILAELKEDNRSQVAHSDLSLSADEPTVAFHEESAATIVSSLAPPSSLAAAPASSGPAKLDDIDLLEDTDPLVRRFVTETLYYLKGFPQKVAVSIGSFSDTTQAGLRKLANQVKAAGLALKSELDISKFLFLNVPLILDREIQQVNQEVKLAQARLEGKMSLAATASKLESEEAVKRATAERKAIVDLIESVYRANIVSALASGVPASHPAENLPVPKLTSLDGFKLEQSAIPIAQLKASSNSQPAVLDFNSTLHEVFSQPSGQHSFLYALISLREWQSFNSPLFLLERLSLEFLSKLLADYQPDASLRSIADGLELLKSVGLVTEQVYKKFSEDSDSKTDKGKAKLKAKSKYFAIDNYYRVTTVADLKAASIKNGPALVTLPVFDADRIEFWKSVGNAQPIGFHTLLLTSFNELSKTVTLRHSLGKGWGVFGQARISFAELFDLVNKNVANVISVEDNALNF